MSRGAATHPTLTYSALRRRIADLLDRIGVPAPWDVTEFCARVARMRGRPIELLPYELPAGAPHGMWLALRNVDVIVFNPHTSVLHREHIICHELGHLLLEHRGEDTLGTLLPDLAPDMLRRMGITAGDDAAAPVPSHSSRQEQEAEVAASIIWRLAGRRLLAPARTLDGDQAEAVDRLAAVLERARRA